MVKFACQTCIKGHRTTTCGHNDRPLYEIKKQGRPRTLTAIEMSRSQIVIEKAASTSDGRGSPTPTDDGGDDDSSKRRKKRKQPDFARPDLPHGLNKSSRLSSSPTRESSPACPPSFADIEIEPCACLSGGMCDCPEAVEVASSSAAASPVLDLDQIFSLDLPAAPLPFFDISAYPPSITDDSIWSTTSDSASTASTGRTSPTPPNLDLDAAEWCTCGTGCPCSTCSWAASVATSDLPQPPPAFEVEVDVKPVKPKIKLCGEGCSCAHRSCTHCIRGPVTLSALIALATRLESQSSQSQTNKRGVTALPSPPSSAPASPPAMALPSPPLVQTPAPSYSAIMVPHTSVGAGVHQGDCCTTCLRCFVAPHQSTVNPPALAF
ncbi:hypothetical protein JCM6882_004935 [Rhodosporidiobolus microsporus]